MKTTTKTPTTIPCPACGKPGGEEIIEAGFRLKACCDSCEREKQEKWRQEEARKRKMERLALWASVCEPKFRRHNPNHPGMPPAFREALDNFDPVTRHGLGLIGESGTGKTHIAIQCLRKCMEAGMSIAVVKHAEIASMALKMAKGGGNTNEEIKAHWIAEQKLKQLHAAGAILIDDIGKGRKTPTADELFFDLVDHRMDKRKITLWTANFGSAWIESRFGEEYGKPIVNRLSERAVIKST